MYIEIIPSQACNIDTLTYSVPEELLTQIKVGSIVKIPFRKGFMYGLVINLTNRKPAFRTRPIWDISKLELNTHTVTLIKWISEYYFCSPHAAAKLFLPTRIWNHKLRLPKTIWYRLKNKNLDKIRPLLTRSKKQLALAELLEVKDRKEDEILDKGFSKQIIKSLIEKNLIERIEESELNRAASHKKEHDDMSLHHRKCSFTAPQKQSFKNIENSEKLLHLLHGVTGSGKTEIYLHLIHEQLESDRQSLLLLPEISLTPQTSDYFKKVFGENAVAVLHSGQTQAQRTASWLKIYSGEAKIIIGARSALFAPFKNLGLIVLDESHDPSFKQDNSPRYNAKRVAAELARLHRIKVIYGSATPNIETYFAAKKGTKISLNHIDEKIAKGSKRDIYISDLRQEWKAKNYSIFSDLLHEKIAEKLAKNEQIILFVNRRGTASAMICRDCGFKETCSTCNIPFTYHSHRKTYLQCHHCGAEKTPATTCPNCGSLSFKFTGLGTEKVEQLLKEEFPEAVTVRADRDTTLKRGSIKEIYNAFKSHKADILIGTQMIAKGWDIPNVTLVGIVLADIGLNIPDFRSSERIFQLLTQVAGRTARGHKHGEVIIQTYNPDNPTIQAAAADNYHEFYDFEIKERQRFSFPPFSKIIRLIVTDKDEKKGFKRAEQIKEHLKQNLSDSSLKIYSTPEFIPFKGGLYHYNVFIQGINPDKALSLLSEEELKEVKVDRV